MFSKIKTHSSTALPDEKASPTPTVGYFDIFKRRKSILANLAAISSRSESLARNWAPLLPLFKGFITYLSVQFSVMSDPHSSDPGWKEFSTQMLVAIDKLQLILDEFSKPNSHIPQLFTYVEELLKQVPSLITYFDKLQWQNPIIDLIPKARELESDLPGLVINRLKSRMPHYETIKKHLDNFYDEFEKFNGLESFSKRSYFEKIVMLSCMQEFNAGMEQFFLALNRLSLQLGITEVYFLNQPLFNRRQFSILDLCHKFNNFYNDALLDAGFNPAQKRSSFPFKRKIIEQQKDILDEWQDQSKLQERINHRYQRTVADIIDATEKAIAMQTDDTSDCKHHQEFLRCFNEVLEGDINDNRLSGILFNVHSKFEVGQNRLHKIIAHFRANTHLAQYASTKNARFISVCEKIFSDMIADIERMHEKQQHSIDCLLKNITTGEIELALAKETPDSPVNIDPGTTFNQLKVTMNEMLEQAKMINATLATRIKSVEQPAAIEVKNLLDLAYGQLEVMLDPAIYRQFIQLDPAEQPGVEFAGDGWIKAVGLSLRRAKLSYAKLKEILHYFTETKLERHSGVKTPEDQLVSFAVKNRELMLVSQELVASLVTLEKDPFVKSLTASAGLQHLLLQGQVRDPALDAEEKVDAEHNVEVEAVDVIGKALTTVARLYTKAAKKHFQDDDRTESTLTSMLRVELLAREYTAFMDLDKNKIQISRTQLFHFLRQHFGDLLALLNDIPTIFSSLLAVSKKEFSLLIRDLNSALRDLVLLFNRIEIEFYLKPGYFTQSSLRQLFSAELQDSFNLDSLPEVLRETSFHQLTQRLYQQLEALNYTFDKCYPFSADVQEQQACIHFNAAADTLKKNYAYHLVEQVPPLPMPSAPVVDSTAKTRADLLIEIDDVLDILTNKRSVRYYFFKQRQLSSLQDVIVAFQALRDLLSRPGYKVTDFLLEAPQHYQLLVKHDKKFLEKLLSISEQSSVLSHEKMIAGDVLPKPEAILSPAKKITLKISYDSALTTRMEELRARCQTATKRKKIALLEALETNLQSMSLEKALTVIHQDVRFKKDFYLLYDGKTGKMLHHISQLTISKADILQQISLEIFRLKQARQQTFYVGRERKLLLIDARMQACAALQGLLKDSATLQQALTRLSVQDQQLLTTYESKLLDKLKYWEAAQYVTCPPGGMEVSPGMSV